MKTLIAVLALIAFAVTGYAITVNPASNVTADSAATALTIPYRDSNGDFSVNVLAFQSAARLNSKTVAQLQVLAPGSAGDAYYCSDCSPKKIVIATGTSAGNFADAAGAQFK